MTTPYISEREKGGFNQLFSKVIGLAAPFAAATRCGEARIWVGD
jgi:hypothetical protein